MSDPREQNQQGGQGGQQQGGGGQEPGQHQRQPNPKTGPGAADQKPGYAGPSLEDAGKSQRGGQGEGGGSQGGVGTPP